MKTLQDHINETEQWMDSPSQGDDFEIDIREGEYIIETYVVDIMDDGVVIHGDDRVLELLEQAGYSFEEIRRYGPVGSSPATGRAIAEEGIDEDQTPAQHLSSIEDGNVDEGSMKDIDIEIQDYERMTPQQFYASYGLRKSDWALKNKEFLKGRQIDWSGTSGFDYVKEASEFMARILELAGCDHKVEEDNSGLLDKSIKDAPVSAMGDLPEDLEMDEAKYHGREVPLGKPMQGDVKKSKVYVRGPKGNVVKVNFGDKDMKIKKSNPKRRKSFRARHNCDNPGPRWKARYWSCRAW